MEVLEKPEIDCIDVVNLLGDYADGDLKPAVRGRFDHHFEGCRHCRRLRDEYLATVEAAKLIRDQPIPHEVHNRVRMALNARLGTALPLVK
jgi:anti-sigma factor RsiW